MARLDASTESSGGFLLATDEPLTSATEPETAGSNPGVAKKRRGPGFCDDSAVRGVVRCKYTGHRNARTMIKQAR